MKESISIKFKDILKNWKVLILIFFLFISYVAVLGFNSFGEKEGVVINGISINSAAEKAGFSYKSTTNLMNLEKIISVNGEKISTIEDFYSAVENQSFNESFLIITNQNKEGYSVILNNENNETKKQVLGISVRDAPSSNIKLGIELEGGSRLILKPTDSISSEQFDMLINSLQNRLDIYGASGTKVNKLEDSYTGEKFIIVESTSSNKNDIFDLIKRQGEFEAKVGNVTVFTGGNVAQVFTDPQRAGLEQCSPVEGTKVQCSFRFQIGIDEAGTDSFFDATSKLAVRAGSLSEKVYFYLDGREITSLSIAKDFKYKKISTPTITVSSEPMMTQKDAIEGGQKEMKLLQTILSTDSLPSELEVVQSYSISSSLGETLLSNAVLVGLFAVLVVAGIVALRYRHFGIFIGIMIALLGEVTIVFGIAAFMKLTIDLSAIGGLIAAIGTGVDDQVIITDEYFRKDTKKRKELRSRQKIKNAFYVIMIAYFTTLAAMIPLMFAGLKMLQGFSFMILIGVTVGVLITRPAYAAILRVLMTTHEERVEEKRLEEEENK